jgi:hypothetical protein
VRVVDLGNGVFEERRVKLTPADAPWIFAAKQHLDWIAMRLSC